MSGEEMEKEEEGRYLVYCKGNQLRNVKVVEAEGDDGLRVDGMRLRPGARARARMTDRAGRERETPSSKTRFGMSKEAGAPVHYQVESQDKT
ncbi:hypothetical protein LZ32DRAFT_343446 [Colletotrichum eremochloae]|nr:hypothetical protein LZ32DRAFT_343446 [Colletotrichum eremochloae]